MCSLFILKGGLIILNLEQDKIRTAVNILGHEYKFVSNASPEYMSTIAQYVNHQLTEIAKSDSRLDSQRISVLALINITDELFRVKESLSQRFNNDVNQLTQEKYYLQEQVAFLDQKLQSHEQEKQNLENKILELKDQIRNYQNENGHTIQQEHEHIKKQYQQLKQQYNQQKEEYHKLQNEYDEWTKLLVTPDFEGS